ncbi:hypothetical protein ABW20_dc0109349 [Dactylellina cionopaga]|nr:hypothetical protein ABW20_dc0109349 [Dactylellina cionopaga]
MSIENLHADRSNAPLWLQRGKKPYLGVRYDVEVPRGSVTIEDPSGLLDPRKSKYFFDPDDLVNEYLDALASKYQNERKKNTEQGYQADYEDFDLDEEIDFASGRSKSNSKSKSNTSDPKQASTEYDIWPYTRLFGPISLKFESDKRYFHVDRSEGWRNREDTGEATTRRPTTIGDFLDVTK